MAKDTVTDPKLSKGNSKTPIPPQLAHVNLWAAGIDIQIFSPSHDTECYF